MNPVIKEEKDSSTSGNSQEGIETEGFDNKTFGKLLKVEKFEDSGDEISGQPREKKFKSDPDIKPANQGSDTKVFTKVLKMEKFEISTDDNDTSNEVSEMELKPEHEMEPTSPDPEDPEPVLVPWARYKQLVARAASEDVIAYHKGYLDCKTQTEVKAYRGISRVTSRLVPNITDDPVTGVPVLKLQPAVITAVPHEELMNDPIFRKSEAEYYHWPGITILGKAGQEIHVPAFVGKYLEEYETAQGVDLRRVRCQFCKVGLRRSTIPHHLREFHPLRQPLFPCSCSKKPRLMRHHDHHQNCLFCICKRRFETLEEKKKHFAKCWPCRCGSNSFQTEKELVHHLKWKCKVCPTCGEKFKTKDWLNRRDSHMKTCIACAKPHCRYPCTTQKELIEHWPVCMTDPFVPGDPSMTKLPYLGELGIDVDQGIERKDESKS